MGAYHPEAARYANYVSGSRRASGRSLFSVGGNVGFALGPVLVTPLVLTLGLGGTGLADRPLGGGRRAAALRHGAPTLLPAPRQPRRWPTSVARVADDDVEAAGAVAQVGEQAGVPRDPHDGRIDLIEGPPLAGPAVAGHGTGAQPDDRRPGGDRRVRQGGKDLADRSRAAVVAQRRRRPGHPHPLDAVEGTGPAGRYGIIALDAFSSDAIPVHLLTRQALGLYLQRLAPHGLLLFHISNRYLDLRPELGGLASGRGLTCRVEHSRVGPAQVEQRYDESTWVVMARHPADLRRIALDPRWADCPGRAGEAWSDDRSSLLGLLK